MSALLWPAELPAPGSSAAAIVVLAGAASLLWGAAYPLSAEAWRARLARRPGADPDALEPSSVLLERVSSGALLGGGAAALWLLAFPGFAPPPIRAATSAAWLVVGLVVVLPVVALSAKSPAMQRRYPEIRVGVWSRALAVRSLGASAIYLLGYELFFRGLLTFGLVAVLGVWPGLSAMTAIYVVAHLRKDASETFACIPMGYVFGLMALQTGSIVAPWLLHVALAWTNEVITARRNPAMEYPL